MSLMSVLFVAKKLLSVLLLPPVLPLLTLVLGLIVLPRRRRAGLILAWCGVVLSLFFTMPLTVNWMAKGLEIHPVPAIEEIRTGQAIVILAGGQVRDAPEYGGAVVNRVTLPRVRYGARLAKQSGLPVLVSGGAPTGVRPEAQSMVDALQEYGVKPRWVEARSLDTQDNARYAAAMLRGDGVQRVVLVTHAAHMRRAVNEFEAVGLKVIPAPTHYFSAGPNGEEFFDYVPSATSAYTGFYVAHEWLGLAAQWLRMAVK